MLSSILRTLSYADIFDYPLTASEIYHWLIWTSSKKPPSLKSLKSLLKKTHLQIHQTNSYFHLPDRQDLASLRRRRIRYSQKKIALARKVGDWLKLFPTIKLVALTGTLAMNNADQDDDIDLFIITSPNALWLTRLLVIPLVSLVAKRRTPPLNPHLSSRSLSNSICLNLWLDQTSLLLPKKQRNLYTAHEIAQIKLLWSRGDAYKKFLFPNSWISQYLPNIKIPKTQKRRTKASTNSIRLLLSAILAFANRLSFNLQYWYMKPKITREKVSLHSAFFHPNNTRNKILSQYHRRLKNLKITP